jgi:hypothetical protein
LSAGFSPLPDSSAGSIVRSELRGRARHNARTPMTTTEIQKLDGRSVLVQPAHSTHNPPIGVRGTVHVLSGLQEPLQLEIALAYPDLVNRPAEKKVIRLTAAQAEEFIKIDSDGDCRCMYPGNLD